MAGLSAEAGVRLNKAIIAVFAGCFCATSASAETARPFSIAPGALGDALIAFGSQGGVTIGVSDPALANRHSKGLHGRHTIRDGLRRLLKGTGGDFLFVDQNTVRVVRAVLPKATPSRPAPPTRIVRPASTVPQLPIEPAEIVVTASKQNTPLSRYPGTATVVDLDPEKNAREASRGTEAIIARLPVLTSTSLGPGRDKLFIRGVADSSFNGPSQSTVGQYLGDVRLTYNAPDPNLNLYDIGRVEVLEGPQGTLYGTGSLGGAIRWVPNAPDTARMSATVSAGGVATSTGGTGGDAAAMANIPVVSDRLAVRAVGYASYQPGYIDDPGRGLTDINRTKSEGGRVALLFRPTSDWSVTVGGALQHTTSRDGQYILRGAQGLTRLSSIAQPFDNNYRLAYVSIAKRWADVELLSTTSIVWHDIATRFDATGYRSTTGAVQFDERIATTLLSHETRLTGENRRGSWVAGFSALKDTSVLRRDIGAPGAPVPIAGVRNEHSEIALFGQYGLALGRQLVLTLGGRLTYSRSVGQLLDEPVDEAPLAAQRALRVSPTLAVSWQINDRLIAFMRYQKAYRAGGVEVGTTESNEKSQTFDADSLTMSELGFRLSPGRRNRFSASATLSIAQWKRIQSDLVDTGGLPYTANIGDGRIYGFDAKLVWRPVDALSLEVSTFLNISRLTAPAPAFAFARERELPNIAEEGGQVRASYTASLSSTLALTVDGSLRYVGPSELGIGFPLDVSQGDFSEIAAGARLAWGNWGLSLDITNLGDVRGNRFAYGNPFGLSAKNQITPLRPRTLRIGIDAKF